MNTGTEMNELEKNTPDDFWRKAFDEAAETPPPRVWDAIERRLDESDGAKILPLWASGLVMSRPFGWAMGVAATVALLLVGWWAVNTQTVDQPTAQLHQPDPVGNVAVRPLAPEKSSTPAVSGSTGTDNLRTDQPTEAVASANKPMPQIAQALVSPVKKFSDKLSNESIARSTATRNVATKPVNKTGDLSTQSMVAANLRRSSSLSVTTQLPPSILSATHERISSENRIARMAVQTSAAYRDQVATSAAPTATDAAIFDQLTGRPLRLRTAGPIQRIVWFRPAELPMEPEVSKSQRKHREMWASASVMPGAFNPMVALKSTQASYANTLVANSGNQSAVTSRASFSVAYQAGAGVQLTERWSVESGIGYLAGHSTVETPAQVASSNYVGAATNQNVVTSNLYVDAIQHSLANKAAASSAAPQTALDLVANNSFYTQNKYINQTQEVLTNNYQYMQVPVQVGYQLRPRKRLSMALLGGILTNIFVKNTVGNDVVVTAKDGVYRPVSLAATMGARFRYRSTGKWSASLAGLYQPSLEFGTKPDSQVQNRPTSTGMSFGVDYHF